MRTKVILILGVFTSLLFAGCDDNLDTKGLSSITQYPTFIVAGGEVVTLVKGETFTDEGVSTKEGYEVKKDGVLGSANIDPDHTDPEEVAYTSAVDTNIPGLYIITYSSVNPQGFKSTVKRYVFVFDKPADPNVDLSGHYTSSTSPAADITKIADGVFYSTNAWGGGSTVVIGAYLICVDGINIQVPQQESLVRVFGYGTVVGNVNKLNLKMSRPTFGPPPLLNSSKVWVKAN